MPVKKCANPVGTPEIDYCAKLKYENALEKMMSEYQLLINNLSFTQEFRDTVISTQSAWENYVENACSEKFFHLIGYSGYTFEFYNCLTDFTKKRNQELFDLQSEE